MKRLRRIALVGIVWLTAATILVAGTPHLVCACPDGGAGNSCARCQSGSVKSALAKPCHPGARCCCCPTQPEPSPAPKPAQPGPAGKAAPEKVKLTAPTCVKALVRAKAFASSEAPTTAHKDLTATSLLLAADITTCCHEAAGPEAAFPEGSQTPPTDLLCLCQRLLI